jgi:hypothetical protein
MLKYLIVCPAVLLASLWVCGSISAQIYPYSYRYCAGSAGDPTSNCGFDTFAQCMASVQGLQTTFCRENPYYRPYGPPLRRLPR